MLLSEVFAAYAADVIAFRNQSFKTEENHNVACKSLISYVGDIDISRLSFNDVRDWKLSLDKRKLSAITIRGYLIKLRVVLAYLESQGYDVLSPDSIPLPKRVEKIPLVLTPEQVQLLIDSTSKYRNKALISLLYSSGLRVSEVCSLDTRDITNDFFTITGKGGKSRICFIDERTRGLLKPYLRRRRDVNPALFISPLNGLRMTPGGVQEVFKYARNKAGFDFPVHPHTMRHSYASNLMMNGIDLYQLMKLMGHSSLDTTKIYLHINDKHLAEDYKKYHTV